MIRSEYCHYTEITKKSINSDYPIARYIMEICLYLLDNKTCTLVRTYLIVSLKVFLRAVRYMLTKITSGLCYHKLKESPKVVGLLRRYHLIVSKNIADLFRNLVHTPRRQFIPSYSHEATYFTQSNMQTCSLLREKEEKSSNISLIH